jgi:4-diphosphocytidyl-2-C-methyl-D-erythritol kinase
MDGDVATMHLSPPAKVNLLLRVGPPSADGFHPLLSWFATVGLFDKLTISPAPGDRVAFTCSDPRIPADDRNLVVRAATLLKCEWRESLNTGERNAGAPPRDLPGVSLDLHKQIPSGGGLGGGSSDAASTLIGLNRFWNLGLSPDQLARLGARLGSDIAFFFGPSSVCTGRGEIVRPIDPPAPKWIVLIFPDLAMPTPAVYRKFDEMKLGDRRLIDDVSARPDWNSWARLPARELLPRLVNDLEPPAFAISPDLARLRQRIERDIDRIVRMSGSGSTLFTLCDDKSEAEEIAASVMARHSVKTIATLLAPKEQY